MMLAGKRPFGTLYLGGLAGPDARPPQTADSGNGAAVSHCGRDPGTFWLKPVAAPKGTRLITPRDEDSAQLL